MQLIEIELSKAYLHRALRYEVADSGVTYCVTSVYLTLLYYITGQYQTVIVPSSKKMAKTLCSVGSQVMWESSVMKKQMQLQSQHSLYLSLV